MSIKTNGSKKIEWLAITAVMLVKSLLTLPFYNKLFGFSDSELITQTDILVAAGTLILAALFSFLLVKAENGVGEGARVLMILAAAEPLFISTLSSVFHVLTAVITVVWVFVCLNIKNRIVAATVSVAAAAIISFVMPCSVFTLVLLGIIVLLISTPNDVVSRIIAVIGAAVSVVATVINVQLSDNELRMHFKLNKMFGTYGGTECHEMSFVKLERMSSFESLFELFNKVAFASLPVIAFVAYVAVTVLKHKEESSKKKTSGKTVTFEKALIVGVMIIPYAFSAFATAICLGTGSATGFNFVPLVIILALAVKGNKYVLDALDRVYAFAKAHPVAAILAVVWIASYSMAFVESNRIFGFAMQFND